MGDTVTYAFDPGNRLTNLAVGAHSVGYEWDMLDRIQGISYDGMDAAYTYHGQGRQVAQVLRENGVVTTYVYDPLARLTNLVYATSARASGSDIHYSLYYSSSSSIDIYSE